MNLVAAQPPDLSVIRTLHVPTRPSTSRPSTTQHPLLDNPLFNNPLFNIQLLSIPLLSTRPTVSVGHTPLKRAAPVKDLESLGLEYVTGTFGAAIFPRPRSRQSRTSPPSSSRALHRAPHQRNLPARGTRLRRLRPRIARIPRLIPALTRSLSCLSWTGCSSGRGSWSRRRIGRRMLRSSRRSGRASARDRTRLRVIERRALLRKIRTPSRLRS